MTSKHRHPPQVKNQNIEADHWGLQSIKLLLLTLQSTLAWAGRQKQQQPAWICHSTGSCKYMFNSCVTPGKRLVLTLNICLKKKQIRQHCCCSHENKIFNCFGLQWLQSITVRTTSQVALCQVLYRPYAPNMDLRKQLLKNMSLHIESSSPADHQEFTSLL